MAFFSLAWQMVFCDLMTQCVQLIVAVPVTLTGEAVGPSIGEVASSL
jgi:hypothetical protein